VIICSYVCGSWLTFLFYCFYGCVWKSHSIPISTKIRLTKALVWPVAIYVCESWTLRQNEETRLNAFEMKGLRKILQVSWTAKKTNEWVLNKAGVKRELLDTVKARKLAYYDHTIRKQGSCLEKEIMQGTMPGTRRQCWILDICRS